MAPSFLLRQTKVLKLSDEACITEKNNVYWQWVNYLPN